MNFQVNYAGEGNFVPATFWLQNCTATQGFNHKTKSGQLPSFGWLSAVLYIYLFYYFAPQILSIIKSISSLEPEIQHFFYWYDFRDVFYISNV